MTNYNFKTIKKKSTFVPVYIKYNLGEKFFNLLFAFS